MMSHCGAVTTRLIDPTFPHWIVAHMELRDPVDSTSTIDFPLHTLQLRFLIKSSPEAISRIRASRLSFCFVL